MELTIKELPQKTKPSSEEDKRVIARATIMFQVVMNQYEKYTEEQKKIDLEALKPQTELDKENPFVVKDEEIKDSQPTIEETKVFVYSSWADSVAHAKTPLYADGKKRKTIRNQTFRDVLNGKYVNKNVKKMLEDYIVKLS